jgi:hypothetical protein
MARAPACRALGPVLALAMALPSSARAFTNPDISVIGDLRAEYADTDGERSEDLRFHEAEVGFVGPLNPYASAEVYLAIHGTEGIEVEEAKLILDRYFPAGLGLTAGVVLLDFGQLNPLHPHAYPFVDRPLMHEEFFSADGARETTARLDWLAPAGPTLRASVGLLRGDVFLGGHDHDHEHEEEAAATQDPEFGVSGRLELYVEPSEDVSFLVGSSVLHGQYDPAESAHATWLDVDAKLQWDLGPYRALVVNAEGVLGRLDATDEIAKQEPTGWFASADLRTGRRFNVGGFAESTDAREDDTYRTDRWGLFTGWALMEETTVFRLLYRRTTDGDLLATDEVILQALFALGPHRPHRY